jgi:hypothetical protein
MQLTEGVGWAAGGPPGATTGRGEAPRLGFTDDDDVAAGEDPAGNDADGELPMIALGTLADGLLAGALL